jgi:hypothetical protein
MDFMCYKQSLPAGKRVREWIVSHVQPVSRKKVFSVLKKLGSRASEDVQKIDC